MPVKPRESWKSTLPTLSATGVCWPEATAYETCSAVMMRRAPRARRAAHIQNVDSIYQYKVHQLSGPISLGV